MVRAWDLGFEDLPHFLIDNNGSLGSRVCANNVVPAEHLAFFLGLQDAGTCYGEEAYVTRLQLKPQALSL